jgi:hypothetical protein
MITCYHDNVIMLSWKRYHVIMKTLSCYHDNVIMLSGYHDNVIMLTLSCYHHNVIIFFLKTSHTAIKSCPVILSNKKWGIIPRKLPDETGNQFLWWLIGNGHPPPTPYSLLEKCLGYARPKSYKILSYMYQSSISVNINIQCIFWRPVCKRSRWMWTPNSAPRLHGKKEKVLW